MLLVSLTQGASSNSLMSFLIFRPYLPPKSALHHGFLLPRLHSATVVSHAPHCPSPGKHSYWPQLGWHHWEHRLTCMLRSDYGCHCEFPSEQCRADLSCVRMWKDRLMWHHGSWSPCLFCAVLMLGQIVPWCLGPLRSYVAKCREISSRNLTNSLVTCAQKSWGGSLNVFL